MAVLGALPQPPFPAISEAFPFIIKNGPKVTPSRISCALVCETENEPSIKTLSLLNPIKPPEPLYEYSVKYFPFEIVIPSGVPPVPS